MASQVRFERPRPKYNAVHTTFMGQKYHSKGEAGYAGDVQTEKLAGLVSSWERQFKIDLRVNGYHIVNYIMDFVCFMPDGSIELREYKGYQTADWKVKWLLLEATLGEVTERYWPGKEVKLVLVNHKSSWKPRTKKGKKTA